MVALDRQKPLVLIGFVAFSICCICLGIALENIVLPLLPFGLLLLSIAILDFKNVYLLFFAILPFSVEVYLPNGLGTDIPSEPLMLLLTGLSIVLLVHRFYKIDKHYFLHPISVLLFLHLFWILFSSIFSYNPTVSYKFLLAKIWYIVPFYGLSLYMLKSPSFLTRWTKYLLYSLLIALCYVMVRHAALGFTFDSINDALKPIFRNHVNYAALLVLFLPYAIIPLKKKYGNNSWWSKSLTAGVFFFLLLAIYLTYTRAAHGAVFIALGSYYIIKYKKVTLALYSSLLVIVLFITLLLVGNRYMDFKPDFNKTITHTNFDNLLEATVKMEDISTMERVYRWVAGYQMIQKEPWTGFGPNSFFFNYKDHSVSAFKTYVSNNPDKSGIHNYYLMLWVEQGIFGFLIFLILCFVFLITGEQVYHSLNHADHKAYVMAAIISMIVILAILLINDMIESDKVGPFFFFNLAVIVHYHLESKKESDTLMKKNLDSN